MPKNSFWVDVREDNKRRIWLWVISWLFFLLWYLVGITLTISNEKILISYAIAQGAKQTEIQTLERLSEAVMGFFSDSIEGFPALAMLVLTVLCAIQGFGYLNKWHQLDFYHSQPVKKGRRFLVKWFNGILIYLIPSFSCLVFAVLIAAVQGLIKPLDLNRLAFMYLGSFLMFLAIYHANLIAIMLTGNIAISICMMIILQGYEAGVHFLRYMLMGSFFDTFVSFFYNPILFITPFYWFDERRDGIWVIAALLIYASITIVVAYSLYRKRPLEAAGRALVYPKTEPVIKYGITIPMALLMALVFWNMTERFSYNHGWDVVSLGGNPFYVAFAIIITTVFICCLMEVIYEFDIKAVFKNKHHISISIAVVTVIFLIFYYDTFGYDRFVPAPGRIKSYALVLEGGVSLGANDHRFFYETGYSLSPLAYAEKNMFATDGENIHALASITPGEGTYTFGATVLYRLKSGRAASRYIWLDYNNPETITYLNRIVSTDEFKKGAFLVFDDYFDDWYSDCEKFYTRIRYQTGVYDYILGNMDLQRLISAYREDLRGLDFAEMNETRYYGLISIEHTIFGGHTLDLREFGRRKRGQINTDNLSLILFEGSERTRTILGEWGIDTDVLLYVEDVDYITIEYNQFTPATLYDYDESKVITVEYHERADIEKIVKSLFELHSCCSNCIWPGYLTNYRFNEILQHGEHFNVKVNFKERGEPYIRNELPPLTLVHLHGNSAQYIFKPGVAPDFVRNDIRGE